MVNTIASDLDIALQKKYHQDLVFNYSEYPTKDHWSFEFLGNEFKSAILDWFPKNKKEKIFFYVHIPFCEELCYFCTCSKSITKEYYLTKIIEILKKQKKIFTNIVITKNILGSKGINTIKDYKLNKTFFN